MPAEAEATRHKILFAAFEEFYKNGFPAGCDGCSIYLDGVGYLSHLRARHLLCSGLPRSNAKHPAIQKAYGLDGPLVLLL